MDELINCQNTSLISKTDSSSNEDSSKICLNTINIASKNKQEIKESNYRFIILFLHGMSNFIVGLAWITFAVISIDFTRYFEISNILNSLNTNSYALAYLLFNFPICYIIENRSLYVSTNISNYLLILGSFFKAWTENSLFFCFLGQFLCATAQPFLFNLNTKIVSTWCRAETRLFYNGLLYIFNTFGMILGFYLPVFIFKSEYSSREEWLNDFNFYIKIPCYLSSAVGLLGCFLFKEKPDNPPSLTELMRIENDENSQTQTEKINKSIMADILKLFKNKQFIILLIYFSVFVGFFTFFYSIVNDIFEKYHFEDKDLANKVSGLANFAGILGNLSFTIFASNTRKVKLLLIIINILFFINFLGFTLLLSLNVKSEWVYYITFFIIGGLNTPAFVLSIDLSCEICYPINDTTIVGILFVVSQIVGYAFTAFLSSLLNSSLIIFVNIIVLILFSISLICIFFLDEKHNKLDIDKGNISDVNN